ncbi:MAG: aminotransferase class IV [Bacteroidia bacterium]|nr:aminotransferase class IV [Bacteroidia bacterium]MDW8416652.1 aminotransferase class IV [Bacteroidia bacterium]
MWYLYAKGSWIETTPPTRGELFGDGVFETIRIWRGRALFLDEHLRRLREAAQVLSLRIPLAITDLKASIEYHANAHNSARVKVVLLRAGEGAYAPPTTETLLRVYVTPLSEGNFPLGSPQRVTIFPTAFTTPTPWSAYKTLSAIGYVQAAAYAQSQGCADAIILSASGHISETSRANLFFWDGENLHTPALRSGCIRGIFRGRVLQIARQLNISVKEGLYPPEMLMTAQEAFTTNVIQGIVPILGIREMGKTFRTGSTSQAELIARALSKEDL